ncbi:mitochondrial 37S ribosomal protein uS8m [Aspergillus homomorphus CBS 101889]|uniref:40S ribosomal protein S8 n=1 Tax=Aspergillus homomorphus (strain CBS 101889) TaxID=1450537 RepID=A0A395HU63_ASPHC|nr:40S ribosomal protein S8 [Aspergillus homomorphus CBS 101889]RAL11357.1 40S ribosomal protein S8 [Aspergillus homomorphus CBS 101889]
MSLSNLSHVISHLNNVNKARLALTSIPNTKLHLKLCLALQNDGLVSAVVRGGTRPPAPHQLLGIPAANDEKIGLEPVTQTNVADRRLWLGLKYWRTEPVLGKMQMVSTPKKRVTINLKGLRKVCQGYDAPFVRGLRSPGESLYVSTDKGIMEARECVEKKSGGMVLCRVENH